MCEKILEKAGLRDCFETIRANPLKLEAGSIVGGVPRLVSAEDKLSLAKELLGRDPNGVAAVGDGYTDIPILDWVQWPVMMDPDLSNRQKHASKPYHFIPSVDVLPVLLTQL